MDALITTAAGEIGEAVAPELRAILDRSPGRDGSGSSPVSWNDLAEAQWDMVGLAEEGATARDLVEIARLWGAKRLPLPYLETLLAKRLSEQAREFDGPVTFALPVASRPGRAVIPFADVEGISVATHLGGGEGALVEPPDGPDDELDLDSRGRVGDRATRYTDTAAWETAITYAASAVGAATELVDAAVRYTGDRIQFGKPVGSFQAVKHMLADALIDLERADTAVIRGSVLLEQSFDCARFATAQSLSAAERALQAHGAIGFTWEMNLHRSLRHIIGARDIVGGLASR